MNLIDVDVLNKDLDWYDLDVCGHCGNEFAAGFEAARELVALAPTIDAEPVRHMGKTTNIETDNLDVFGGRIIVTQGKFCRVYYEDESIIHCKDCKHWGTGYGGETEHIKVCEYANYMVSENGYCVYGERKMDEEVQHAEKRSDP